MAEETKLQEQPLSRHDILENEKNKASHLQPWQFKKGQSGNPKGRVPGKSLKERAKAMLNAMTEEEEQAFFEGIDKRTIWEMAEGKAESKTDITTGGQPLTWNEQKTYIANETLPKTDSSS